MIDDPGALPKRRVGDYAHTAAKAGLSLITIAGGAAAELFSLVLAPPLDLELENLQNNEAFMSLMLQATQTAMRTHQREKLEALPNAVLNVATSKSLDEEKQLIFLGLVDIFTVTHLEILRLFVNPG
jgi:hypothetical protein